ncbi:MAG: transporter [Pseudomonadota bacterium]
MKSVYGVISAIAVSSAGMGHAGIDLSGQPIGLIFETGTVYQFSYGVVDPEVTSAVPATSDATSPFGSMGFGFKNDINETLSYALIVDQPYGADIAYSDGPFAGGYAFVDSKGVTALLRYKFDENFSVYGGLRALQAEGSLASIGLLDASSDWGLTPVVGAAYERTDIALRVALTYTAPVTLDFSGTENFAPVEFDVDFPESWALDFQTGLNPKTLLFGQIRYVPWAGTNLTAGAGTYVDFADDETTYTLGLGRRITDDLSGSLSVTYLGEGETPTTNTLAPTNGRQAINLGLSYDAGNGVTVAGGVSYQMLGDQTVLGVPFSDNSAWGAGFRVTVAR